jgi:hypothetical protein
VTQDIWLFTLSSITPPEGILSRKHIAFEVDFLFVKFMIHYVILAITIKTTGGFENRR